MSTQTLPVQAPAVPDLDRPDGDQIGDEILIASAGAAKTTRVSGTSSRTQQHEARAWTKSGYVD